MMSWIKYIQASPPGTHRPVAPDAEVQVSCFRDVFGTQQLPDGTGRFWFCGRATAEVNAARPRTAVNNVVAEKCMLIDWLVDI
jgi:hypothetical protein